MTKMIYKKRVLENEILVTFDYKENHYLFFLNGTCIGGNYSKYNRDEFKEMLSDIIRDTDILLQHDNLQSLLDDIKKGVIA